MSKALFGSLTRIADLPPRPLAHEALPRERWEAADYVVAEVLPYGPGTEGFELCSGRTMHPMAGDLLVGALSRRYATLEATGTFEAVGEDGLMDLLTEAGCFGRATSWSPFCPPMIPVRYRGHVLVDGAKTSMRDYVPEAPSEPFHLPVVLLAGTSMSAGKTHAARVAVRQLVRRGRTVVAAKLTGAARRHDTLAMGDAGAEHTFDFVDAGLPTTVCPADEYRDRVGGLLRRMAATGADVAVIEAGASPLEPYNGGTLAEMLADRIAFTIVAASDPYAVVGIRESWGRSFDVVTGPTANTKAGIALVERLIGLPALDLMRSADHGRLGEMLEAALVSRRVGEPA